MYRIPSKLMSNGWSFQLQYFFDVITKVLNQIKNPWQILYTMNKKHYPQTDKRTVLLNVQFRNFQEIVF